MADDIVNRLREIPPGIGGFYYKTAQAAADEIERLLARYDDDTKLFSAMNRVTNEDAVAIFGLREKIELLRKERDEARRLYITEMCLRDYGDTSDRIREAKARGWECFDSDGWSDPGDECQREAL
jgi:hypothetical protein